VDGHGAPVVGSDAVRPDVPRPVSAGRRPRLPVQDRHHRRQNDGGHGPTAVAGAPSKDGRTPQPR